MSAASSSDAVTTPTPQTQFRSTAAGGGSKSKLGVVAILLIFLIYQALEFKYASPNSASLAGGNVQYKQCPKGIGGNPSVTVVAASESSGSSSTSLVPGELPGYTGWARPEQTMAGYFTIESFSEVPSVGTTFEVSVKCVGHQDCGSSDSLFFLRAYGPSVVPGRVIVKMNGQYTFLFEFMDPGSYTVEGVLSFSNPPPIDKFPLPDGEQEPPYEGYLLPGFPLQVQVSGAESIVKAHSSTKKKVNATYCTLEELSVLQASNSIPRARWKVTSKSNTPGYTSKTLQLPISEEGYKRNIHSLGIAMEYVYESGCMLLPRSAFSKKRDNDNPFSRCKQKSDSDVSKLQVVFIGDSVMRVQKDMFDGLIGHLPNVETVLIELYGGYRRCEKYGPDIKGKLDDLIRQRPDDKKVLLFNTGLHDIHRLCGVEWKDDRSSYLSVDQLGSGKFKCIDEYRKLIKDFAVALRDFPADLKIFQTSTAAWPKHGNFNIQWKPHGQAMPLAPEIVSQFNDVALEVLRDFSDDIYIMDGFWITYSRPDNREYGDIGHKLSHPGLEVQGAMVSIFVMMVLRKVCFLEG